MNLANDNWYNYKKAEKISNWHLIKNFFLMFERQRQSMNRGWAEREGDTESETDSRLWAVSTADAGLELTNSKIVTWAEVGRSTDWATQAPLDIIE